MPENEAFPLMAVTEGMDFEVWGVVVASVHLHARGHDRAGRRLVARALPRGDGREGDPPRLDG